MANFTKNILRLGLVLLAWSAGTLRAEPGDTSPTFREAMSRAFNEQIPEIRKFYRQLELLKLAGLEDLDVGRVAFGGGFVRALAKKVHEGAFAGDQEVSLKEILDSDRDLDLVYLDSATSALSDATRAKITDTLQKILNGKSAEEKIVVRNVELKTVSEKRADPLILTQGFDSPSQALMKQSGVMDLMDLLNVERTSELRSLAVDALEKRRIDYILPEVMSDTRAFLNQVVEVARIFKLRIEDPQLTLTAEAETNIAKVLGALQERSAEIHVFLKSPSMAGKTEPKYYLNRMSDVFGWVMKRVLQSPPQWFTEIETKFGLWKFFSNYPQLKAHLPVPVNLLQPEGSASSAKEKAALQIADVVKMGGGLEFNPATREITFDVTTGVFKKKTVKQKVAVVAEAMSGASGGKRQVASEVLPLDQFEVLQVKKSPAGDLFALVRHQDSKYSTIVQITTDRNPPVMKFLNGRSFSGEAVDGAHAGKGATGWMVSTVAFDFEGNDIVAVLARGAVKRFAWRGSSYVVSPLSQWAPTTGVVQVLYENGELYSLLESGHLIRTPATGQAELVSVNVLGIFRNAAEELSILRKTGGTKDDLEILVYRKQKFLKASLGQKFDAQMLVAAEGGGFMPLPLDKLTDVIPQAPVVAAVESAGEISKTDLIAQANELHGGLKNAELKTLMTDVLKGEFKPELMTAPGTGHFAKIQALITSLTSEDRASLAQIIARRLVLELRRNNADAEFKFSPSTWIVGGLVNILLSHPELSKEGGALKILAPYFEETKFKTLMQTNPRAQPAPIHRSFLEFQKLAPADCKATAGKLARPVGAH